MSNGIGITLIAVGAILRFALAAGSPHGLNVHVVGVVLIVAGVIELLLSLLVVRGGPRRPRSLVRQGRGGYYDRHARRDEEARPRLRTRTGQDADRKTIFRPGSGVPLLTRARRRVR